MHRFPKNNKNLFNMWLEQIKPSNYQSMTTLQIYNKYYVCEAHFLPSCLVQGTRRGLTADAVPSENISKMKIVGDDNRSLSTSAGSSTYEPVIDMEVDYDDNRDITITARPENESEIDMLVEYTEHVTPTPSISSETQNTVLHEVSVKASEEKKKYLVRKHVPSRKGIRRNILQNINVSRAIDLSPKCKKFYKTLSAWRNKMYAMQSRITSYRTRLTNAENFVNSSSFSHLLKFVNDPTYNFIMCQIKNQNVAPFARRYSLEEKMLALSIMKNSRKAYRFLSKIFVLPTQRTLTHLLQKIPFTTGINNHIFLSMEKNVNKMENTLEKVCILMFDEMSIDSSIYYQKGEDNIIGLEDDGNEKHAVLADHANVFLLRGLYKQWKQPICFTFSCGSIKAIILKQMIRKIINRCQQIGLTVVATVCDQGSTNQTAINTLLRETNEQFLQAQQDNPYFGFVEGNQEVIPLFDVPHLMKGIHNNLLSKNLHFYMHNNANIAKWDHIVQFYKLDSLEPSLRICSKLTDSHILKEKMNKMKVKNCTQVFSNTVGVLMKRISMWDIKNEFNLPIEAQQTADLILFLDQLFDSLNVTRRSKPEAKPLKWPISNKSQHEKFWRSALKIIESMKFFCLKKNQFVYNPTLKNFKFTLRAILYLKNILLNQKNFKYFLTGALNQDPIENFFGLLRSHGVTNTNPDAQKFTSSFKSLIINNFMASHSPGSNCLKDNCSEALDNLRCFLTGEFVAGIAPLDNKVNVPIIPVDLLTKETKIGRCTSVYMSGYIAKLLLKECNNCESCRKNILFRTGSLDDDFIEARQYDNAQLKKPGSFLTFLVANSLNHLFYLIPQLCTKNNISEVLSQILKEKFCFAPMNCHIHNLFGEKVCQVIVKCALFWWCKSINKIVKGKDSKFIEFLARKPNMNSIDPVKLHAHKKYLMKKKIKKN